MIGEHYFGQELAGRFGRDLRNQQFGSNLGSLAAVWAIPLDRASSTSPRFSNRGFEDEVLLVAMDLLLDAYM